MTADQLYAAYLCWLDGGTPLPQKQLLYFPLIDRDIFEDASWVVNRRYFAIPRFVHDDLRLFLFFEECCFTKDSTGGLQFSSSEFFVLQN